MTNGTIEIVYRWPDGREEVRYSRPAGSSDGKKLTDEVRELHSMAKQLGYESPYFVRQA